MSKLINATSLGNFIIVTGSFLLLLFLIKKFAWTQITEIFEARAQKIADDLDGAKKSRQEAEELKEKHQQELLLAKDEVGQILDTARQTGKLEGEKIISEAQREAKRQLSQAKQTIAQDKEEAMAEVKDQVADLSFLLAEKFLTKELDEKAQSDLIDSYLEQLGEN